MRALTSQSVMSKAGSMRPEAPRRRGLTSGIALVLAGLVFGVATYLSPTAGVALATLSTLIVVGLGWPARMQKLFYIGLAVLLIGYAFLGRGFAYLGAPPIYIGEVVLAIAVIALVGKRNALQRMDAHGLLLVVFMAWGALRTFPFVSIYGFDALRDGVIWGYAIFALAVLVLLSRRLHFTRIVDGYRRILPWLLVWIPLGAVITRLYPQLLLELPGSGVRLISVKVGDMGVHLGGTAAFLLLGLAGKSGRAARHTWAYWAIWMVGFVVIAAIGRSAMLAAVAGASIAVILQPAVVLKRFAPLALLVGVSLLLLVALDVSFSSGGQREISVSQIAANAVSIFDPTSGTALRTTVDWRLSWWTEVVDYTVFGEYFWGGKGFGINLANADGFQTPDQALRSPHNAHMTILARSGVPGILLWCTFLIAFPVAILRATSVARRHGDHWWTRVNLWILAYWTAFVVNGTFDVFLEGPQGGIWFWCVVGAGLAAMETQKRERQIHRSSRDDLPEAIPVEATRAALR